VGQGPDALLAARAATRGPSIAFVGALFANRSAQAYLSTLKVPVYTQSGEATPASVVGPLATWVLSLKTM
ncbi:MAG: hypothetical protein O2917_00300, partial [Acidobacteria bacterium]|nr:hypothetical protein [Acidobacteriota bacterium]